MNRSRLVLGPTFVAVGALALGEQAGLVDAWPVIAAWWPLLVVSFGLAQLFGRPRNPLGGALSLLVGVGLLAFTLGAVDSLALLWPLLLVALGLWLLLARPTLTTTHVSSLDDLVAVFDDRDLTVPAGPFPGGTVTTVFGDLDLDLSAATLPDGEATLQVTTVFGDVDVTIPPDWEVRVNGPEIFGSVRVPPPPTRTDDVDSRAPVLHLRAATVFGDLTVRPGTREEAGATPGR
jgi:hypothetical protein